MRGASPRVCGGRARRFHQSGRQAEKDPDRRVQAAIELAIEKVAEWRRTEAAHLVSRHKLDLPTQVNSGPVEWRVPRFSTLHESSPTPLMGARTLWADRRDRALWRSRSQARGAAQASCRLVGVEACRPSRLHRLGPGGGNPNNGEDNVPTASRGRPARAAVLARLLRCRRCGGKLTVQYTGAKGQIRRTPASPPTRLWRASCIGFGGLRVDDVVESALLSVVQPAAVNPREERRHDLLAA